MSYSNIYQPCDHVSLMFTSANRISSDSRYRWTIPPDYFSNQRGSLCTVQLVGGAYSLVTATEHAHSLVVHYVHGSANAFTVGDYAMEGDHFNVATKTFTRAQRSHDPVLCTGACTTKLKDSSVYNTSGDLKPAGEFLVPARPHEIQLHCQMVNASTKRVEHAPENFGATITLKFTYYDAVGSAVNLHDKQNYRTL